VEARATPCHQLLRHLDQGSPKGGAAGRRAAARCCSRPVAARAATAPRCRRTERPGSPCSCCADGARCAAPPRRWSTVGSCADVVMRCGCAAAAPLLRRCCAAAVAVRHAGTVLLALHCSPSRMHASGRLGRVCVGRVVTAKPVLHCTRPRMYPRGMGADSGMSAQRGPGKRRLVPLCLCRSSPTWRAPRARHTNGLHHRRRH
jgi:hypothetical protein